jgi:hypothetical protein
VRRAQAATIVLGTAVGVALAFGCDGTAPQATGVSEETPRPVVGIVVAVEGTSPAQVDRFTLRTSEGRVLVFEVGQLDLSGGAFPAAHLRDHQASAEPVVVEYRVEGGRPVATRLTDAP